MSNKDIVNELFKIEDFIRKTNDSIWHDELSEDGVEALKDSLHMMASEIRDLERDIMLGKED